MNFPHYYAVRPGGAVQQAESRGLALRHEEAVIIEQRDGDWTVLGRATNCGLGGGYQFRPVDRTVASAALELVQAHVAAREYSKSMAMGVGL